VLRKRVKDISGHPADLVLRDIGVLELHIGHGKKTAARRFKQSLEIIQSMPASPGNKWFYLLTQIHLVEIRPEIKVVTDALPDTVRGLVQQVDELAPRVGILQAYRKVSPY